MSGPTRLTWATLEYGTLLCPLPVLRNVDNDDPDLDPRVVVAPCREPVFLAREQSGELDADGLADDYLQHWQVKCLGHHVLVVNDDDDREPTVEPRPELIVEALRAIGDSLPQIGPPSLGHPAPPTTIAEAIQEGIEAGNRDWLAHQAAERREAQP